MASIGGDSLMEGGRGATCPSGTRETGGNQRAFRLGRSSRERKGSYAGCCKAAWKKAQAGPSPEKAVMAAEAQPYGGLSQSVREKLSRIQDESGGGVNAEHGGEPRT
jgi:hypothetical protein